MNGREFAVDDLLNMSVPSDASVAPGGDRIAYLVANAGADKGEKSPESRVWVVELDREQSWQVTYGPGSDRHPCWSPEGDRLAFLSDRVTRGTTQLYVLDDSPRDARRLTELPGGASEPQWAPDGSRLAVLSTDHVPETDNDVKLFDADRQFRRLYLVDSDSGETSPVDHGDLQIWEYCWSPDGKQIAAIVSGEPFLWAWYEPRLVLIDVGSGNVSSLYKPGRQIARPAWSLDGTRIALISSYWSDPGMTGGDVLLLDASNGSSRNLTGGHIRSYLTIHWLPDGDGLLTMALERGRAQVALLDLEGHCIPRWTDELGVNDYGATFDPTSGTVASVLSGTTRPPEVWTGRLAGERTSLSLRPVTSSNDLPGFPDVTAEWLTWGSTDGLQIEGLYLAPSEAAGDSAPPLATLVHGGPTGVVSPVFPLGGTTSWIPFLLQNGIAVFMPNFRGSNGYGVEFAEANLGDLGGLDLQDVLTGVESCIERGLADPARLGIGGWSYGGFLTAWAITQTPLFRAAVAGASITNWYSFHGGTSIPEFASQYVRSMADELDGPYAWTSPLFACKHVQTPTLFLHGEQDPVCPVGQAYEMTRALRRRGVEVDCAVYPREGHGFVERGHRRDMIERAVGWFATHLGTS